MLFVAMCCRITAPLGPYPPHKGEGKKPRRAEIFELDQGPLSAVAELLTTLGRSFERIMASARNGHEEAQFIAHFGLLAHLPRGPRHTGGLFQKGPKRGEGNMERKHQSQTSGTARPERSKVKLDRRYGEIGISAVAAAVQCKGEKQEQSARESTLVLAETD